MDLKVNDIIKFYALLIIIFLSNQSCTVYQSEGKKQCDEECKNWIVNLQQTQKVKNLNVSDCGKYLSLDTFNKIISQTHGSSYVEGDLNLTLYETSDSSSDSSSSPLSSSSSSDYYSNEIPKICEISYPGSMKMPPVATKSSEFLNNDSYFINIHCKIGNIKHKNLNDFFESLITYQGTVKISNANLEKYYYTEGVKKNQFHNRFCTARSKNTKNNQKDQSLVVCVITETNTQYINYAEQNLNLCSGIIDEMMK